MRSAAEAGAAIVAAHPNADEPESVRGRLTKRFSRDTGLRELAHRFELFNRRQLFGWVADAGLPAVASGDFHTPEHLVGWKTLLPSTPRRAGGRRLPATAAPGLPRAARRRADTRRRLTYVASRPPP